MKYTLLGLAILFAHSLHAMKPKAQKLERRLSLSALDRVKKSEATLNNDNELPLQEALKKAKEIAKLAQESEKEDNKKFLDLARSIELLLLQQQQQNTTQPTRVVTPRKRRGSSGIQYSPKSSPRTTPRSQTSREDDENEKSENESK